MKALIIIFVIWLIIAIIGVIVQIVLTLAFNEKIEWKMFFKQAALWPVFLIKLIGKALKL